MLDALISLTETDEFEDSGGLYIRSFNATAGAVDLALAIYAGDSSPEQHWRVHCEGVQQFRIQDGWVDNIAVATEHPLLWQFTESVVAVYFRGPVPTPLAIIGALYERHLELAGAWIPFHLTRRARLSLSVPKNFKRLCCMTKRAANRAPEIPESVGAEYIAGANAAKLEAKCKTSWPRFR